MIDFEHTRKWRTEVLQIALPATYLKAIPKDSKRAGLLMLAKFQTRASARENRYRLRSFLCTIASLCFKNVQNL